MPLSVSRISPAEFDAVWAEVEPMAASGFRHGAGDTITPDEIRASVISGDMEMWAVHDADDITAVVVIQIIERPQGRVLAVVLVAGRGFASWGQQVQELLQEYASLIGADWIEAVARDGMAKWLSRMGWKRKATLMELKNGRQEQKA